MKRITHLALAVSVLVVALAAPATAQDEETTSTTIPDSLVVSTPYPGVAAEPGDQVSFALQVAAPQRADVALSVSGVPDGWTAVFRGGGFVVDRVTAGPGLRPEVSLDVTVPVDATDGQHDFTVTASSPGDEARVPLSIRVSQEAGGAVTLTPDFPGLRAPAGDEVTFTLELRNDTPSDLQFELEAAGPAGWDVVAEPASQAQASTLAVDAGTSQNVTLRATSPIDAEATQYPITVRASAGETTAEIGVIVEIVGSFSAVFSTADQRLNAEVTAGDPTDLALLVTNTGTAPLQGVAVTATPPQGWEVTFAPEAVPVIAPGETATVTATITPSGEALAGDYVVSFALDHDEVEGSLDIRTTVNPSRLWGFVGIAVVALTLAGLAWVFRRFGRR